MKYIVIGYNQSYDWINEYTDDYLIYDRSESDEFIKDLPQEKVIKTENIGNVDFDRLSYIVDNYYTLPDVFVLTKANLFKYITKEEFDKVKDNSFFTPLLTQNHKTYSDSISQVCYYAEGIYWERNDNWYVHQFPFMYRTLNEFAFDMGIPQFGTYVPFAPGGNYILTRDTIYKYGIDFYKKMRDTLPYTTLPAEAHFCERSYYTIWK